MHRHGYLAGGQNQVRLEMTVAPSRVEVFRTWAWHKVYCGLYLGTRRQERDWWYRRRRAGVTPELHDSELDEPWRSELEHSWSRLFKRLPRRSNCAGEPGGLVAVVEVLRLGDIQRGDVFQTTHRTPQEYIAVILRRPRLGR